MTDQPTGPQDEPPSKSSRKREMTAAQELGAELLTLNKRQLASLALPETLLAALKEYNRLPNKNEARRRQLQYIGKLMRSSDYEQIREAVERLHKPSPAEVRRGRRIEQWLSRLLQGDEADINEFLAQHPAAQRQELRQLIRNCANGDEPEAAPRRRLLDYLNAHVTGNP